MFVLIRACPWWLVGRYDENEEFSEICRTKDHEFGTALVTLLDKLAKLG